MAMSLRSVARRSKSIISCTLTDVWNVAICAGNKPFAMLSRLREVRLARNFRLIGAHLVCAEIARTNRFNWLERSIGVTVIPS